MTNENNNNPRDITPDQPPVEFQEQDSSTERLIEKLRVEGKLERQQDQNKIEQLMEQVEQAKKSEEEYKDKIEQLTAQVEQARKIKEESKNSTISKLIQNDVYEISRELINYAIQALGGLILFVLFLLTSIGVEQLCRTWPESSMMIMLRIISWTILALGAFCCTTLVTRNTISFIKFLMIKNPSQKISEQKDSGRLGRE